MAVSPKIEYVMSPRAFAAALLSGGDERLAIQDDGLNRYGCAPRPRRAAELGSCTSSTISERGHLAAFDLWRVLCAKGSAESRAAFVEEQCDDVRERLREWLGRPSVLGEIVLTPSGTDAELVALYLVARRTQGGICNIVVAPNEVGSGTSLAASGRHFAAQTPSGESSQPDEAINVALSSRIHTVGVEARDAMGRVRPESEIEAEIATYALDAMSRGETVLLHCVAHSKTGIRTPTPESLARLDALGPGIYTVVDAAQGRISKASIKQHLAQDRMVLFTGSKFFGGPTFSGALFLPSALAQEPSVPLPAGYGDYFTRAEFPPAWREERGSLGDRTNVGLLLRWQAALAEMQACDAILPAEMERPLTLFSGCVEEVFRGHEWLHLVRAHSGDTPLTPPHADPIEAVPTVFNFRVEATDGESLSKATLARWHGWLNRPLAAFLRHGLGPAEKTILNRSYHLGQPVVISPGASGTQIAVLRIALGAPLLVSLAGLSTTGGRSLLMDMLLSLRAKIELIRAFGRDLDCA